MTRKVNDHLNEFFAMAQAHERNLEGTPSGDRVLDALPPVSLLNGCNLQKIVDLRPTTAEAVTVVMLDWWLAGSLAEPRGVIWARVERWLLEGSELEPKLENLIRLAGMGLVGIPGDAPARRVGWSTVKAVIDRIVAAPIRSMGQVHDLVVDMTGVTAARNVVRLLRRRFPAEELPWAVVTPGAACAIGWALRNAPYAFHPATRRQDELLAALDLLRTKATEERWPVPMTVWTPDALLGWCEMAWQYLKIRWPHLKDPAA